MVQWYNFYGHDDVEPEIKVGLYDRWLSLLRSGPTQVERVLVHTPMMDLAHERRFVVSETKQSMSHFEVEHSQRVEMTINHLEAYFANNPSDQLEDSILREPQAPTGLAPNVALVEIFKPAYLVAYIVLGRGERISTV
ncbi:hypothetical protein H2198_001262 [Neophaeococcomyces mojaviensis]|uniref:Uncharacterized protein n=1 Tax=Neophaeococcomyces mojaviensis TaxID=3383035 RepID=A0ACC3AHB7_9EURO|nr:hypothetical protein H2198_001262 [Knufia sp. JES_112]